VFPTGEDTPGPGEYETAPPMKKPRRWAGKLRVRTQRMHETEERRDRPWSQGPSPRRSRHS
jgi:hypothetical protein